MSLMRIRPILISIGLAGALLCLAWAAFAHFEKLNIEIGRLEAGYEQLEQKLAVLALERQHTERILLRHEQNLHDIQSELAGNLASLGKSLRDNEETRAWAAAALPADLAGLFGKPGSLGPAQSTGRPAANSAGTATGGAD